MLRSAIKRIPGSRRVARWLGLTGTPTGSRQFLLDMLPKESVGAEIGVHLGHFSQKILASISPRELHLIDPWEHLTSGEYEDAWYGGRATGGQAELDDRYSRVLAQFEEGIASGRVKVHRGYSAEVLERFPDGYLDWVYIDGNHLYEYVKRDLELSLRKVRSGGYIAGDDYTDGGWWGGGVKKAVDEFAGIDAVRLVTIRNGQFVLSKV